MNSFVEKRSSIDYVINAVLIPITQISHTIIFPKYKITFRQKDKRVDVITTQGVLRKHVLTFCYFSKHLSQGRESR